MLTVVLADDDYLVKEILCENIPWNELGMEVIGLAENGKEALDLCMDLKPDILVTDIKMPFYNGLEVAIQLMENHIQTKTILISGVQDFNYARIALNVQAAGYILKPIQLKEVIAVLKKVRDAIEMEFQREQVVKRLEQQLAENMSTVRDKFLNYLVSEGALNNGELQERLDYFKLPLKAIQDIIVVVAEIDDYESRVKSKGIDRIQFYNFSIKNLIEQILNNYQAGICFTTRDNEFVIVFCGEYCKEDKMTQIFESIEQLLHDFDGITLSMGVGHCVSLKSANLSYSCACSAMSYKFYTGNNSIIHINDIVSTSSMDKISEMKGNTELNSLKKTLLTEIKLGNRNRVHHLLEEYCVRLTQAKQLSKHYIRGLFLELIIDTYREFCETEGEVTEVISSYTASMQSVISVETIREIQTHSSGVLLCIAEYYGTKYNNRHSALIERIKNYVNQSYMDNISLADIANEIYMSPSYICAVFKRETGSTINEYIIEKKMSSAKKMLTGTKMKVLEIAEQLGYENSQYFSYSFKKYTGETPQQYRSRSTSQIL
ncbi:AraC family transcriptional regulator [Paenibacillus sepulcri]|uniref:AraC family transcriptional regulator n=1 Tax=Paenibacillus sepulcri TaxID=359917 RepID=A0ABS7BXS7_9BACL|nr:AraC family transcriptional regulator [Paenibacillus sepulcri]